MKMKFKTVVSLLLALSMLLVLAVGCGTQAPAETQEKTTAATTKAAEEVEKEITVGFVAFNMAFTWMQYAAERVKKSAADAGIKLVVYDANNDAAKQTSLIEDLIAQKVDGIITSPIDVKSMVPALEAADKAGIPVVTFDRRADGAPYFAFVGSDDRLGGSMIAAYIAQKLNGKGNVVEIVGQLGAGPTIDRGEGFHEEIAKSADIKVVFSQSGKFEREAGMRVMEDAINAVGKDQINAVFAHNDDMMMGAIQAMKDAGMDLSKVITISYDGVPDSLKAIKAGEHEATLQYPVGMAGAAATILINYLKDGTKPEKVNDKIDPWIIESGNLNTGDFFPELSK
ncbi:MAG: hypothetical protein A2Y21_00275 [Clostridiales bacterium GWC2_40_7]|nr:MAG: hypothetical protein A2Y21_00275 [Clostridiales bacterium GWC2_40_7]